MDFNSALKWTVGAIATASIAVLATGLSVPTTGDAEYVDTKVEASVQLGKFCSGTFIEDPIVSDGIQPTVLTARHCTSGMRTPAAGIGQVITISNESGINQDFEVVLVSEESDVAILQPVDKNWSDERIVTADVVTEEVTYKFGEKVWAVGYPGGTGKTMTDGYLGYLEEVPAFGAVSISKLFQKATVLSIGGSSGQGMYVLEDGDYRLMGVLTGGLGPFASYYTPLGELQEFLLNAESLKADQVKISEEDSQI